MDFIDEDSLLALPKFRDWYYSSGYAINHERINWYYQQFLKLLYYKVSSTDFYFVMDSDVVLNRPLLLTRPSDDFEKIDVTYFVGSNLGHDISVKSVSRLLKQNAHLEKFSFIADMMCFKKSIVEQLILSIESNHNQPFYKAAIAVEQGNDARFSEFELYGIFANFINQNNTRPYYLESSGEIRKRLDLDEDLSSWDLKRFPYIAYHHWAQ
jgi:hypothetical protein